MWISALNHGEKKGLDWNQQEDQLNAQFRCKLAVLNQTELLYVKDNRVIGQTFKSSQG